MTSSLRFPSKKISALVSDVDGTLVTDDKILTARAQAAVAELRASGITFTIISSRPPRGLRMLLEPLGITTPVSGFNGGVITTPDLSVITEHLLSPDTARRALDMLYARQVQVWVFSGQDWLVRDPEGPYVRLEEHTVGFRPTVVENFGHALDSAAKIVGVSKDFEHLARCEQDLRASWLTKPPSFVLSPTTSTSPIRSPTRVSHCRNSRGCWLFRWRTSPSSATAAMMLRCSSGVAFASRWAMPARRCSGLRIS